MLDLDSLVKIAGVIAVAVSVCYQFFQWRVGAARTNRIKADLEILKLLDKDSRQYDLVDQRVEQLINLEYGTFSGYRRRSFWRLVIVATFVATIGGLAVVGAFLNGDKFWGYLGTAMCGTIIFGMYFQHRSIPQE